MKAGGLDRTVLHDPAAAVLTHLVAVAAVWRYEGLWDADARGSLVIRPKRDPAA